MENIETNVNVNEEKTINNENENTNVQANQVDSSKNENTDEKMIPQSKVNEILNKKFAEWKQKSEAEKEAEKVKAREAEKLAQMSESERMATELANLKEMLEKKEQEEARKGLEAATLKELSVRGIDADFLDFVIAADAEKTKEKLDIFDKKFNAMVDAKVDTIVKDRLRGGNQVTGTTEGNKLSAFELAFKGN